MPLLNCDVNLDSKSSVELVAARDSLRALGNAMGLGAAWFWPNVSTRRFAQNAMQEAFWVSAFVSAVTAILTAISFLGPDESNPSASGFIDSAMFAGLAFGIYRRSRIAAVSAFVLYLAGSIFQFAAHGPAGWILRGLIALALFHGVRGAIAYRNFPTLPANLPSVEQSFRSLSQTPLRGEGSENQPPNQEPTKER